MVVDLDEVLPSKIKIGYSYYSIEIQDDKWMEENEATGDSCTDNKVINICDSWDYPTVIDTLKHEIRHVLWDFFGISELVKVVKPEEIEEFVIRTLTTGEEMVLHDNPELKKVFYG